MSKHVYSLSACADAIEHFATMANSARGAPKPRASVLELQTAQVQQVIDMLRDPVRAAAINAALAALAALRPEGV